MKYIGRVEFDREKFKDVVHYVCSKCVTSELGAVKLHKVLYYSDMIHYVWTGRAITGATYRKRAFGPTADYLLRAITELEASQRLSTDYENFYGYRKRVFRSHQKPDDSRLEDSEKELIDDVIDFVCLGNTARSISEISHNHVWERTDSGDPIPYYTAYDLYPADVSDNTLAWARGEATKIEGLRSKKSDVDYKRFSAFRSSVQESKS